MNLEHLSAATAITAVALVLDIVMVMALVYAVAKFAGFVVERRKDGASRGDAGRELTASEARFQAVFDGSPTGVAIVAPNGQLMRTNRALREMFETVEAEHVGARHPFFSELVKGGRESFSTKIAATGADGEAGFFEVTVSLIRDDDGRPLFAMAMINDVTERERAERRLVFDATHDALCGLPNRSLFLDHLAEAFVHVDRRCSAVLFIDLDEFKFINDSLGHVTGDKVLVGAALRLQEMAGARDVVARLGGDEFAVLVRDRASLAEIEAFVTHAVRSFSRPLDVDGRDIFVTASIGVAVVDGSYERIDDVLRDADTAMYRAKEGGRARYALFDQTMHAHASWRLDVATEMRYAVERREFYLEYQPIVSLTDGRIEAVEALLRWEHPRLGSIPPSKFIPVAEEIGLIVPIGRLAFERACARLARWKRNRACDPRVRMNVNTSVREIVQPDYATFLRRTIEAHGLVASDLVIEVTESGLLGSGKPTDGALERIKAVGVGLAIDDFGTGYSSLRYVQQYPFDEIKIDRSFVSGSNGALASEPIVSMLVSLGRSFNVSVVAEGVETAGQAARLRALGCPRAQGYYFAKPGREVTFDTATRRRANVYAVRSATGA